MNWALAAPEIVLACIGMAILVFGVLRKQDSTLICTMLTLGGFLIAAWLAVTRAYGIGYYGLFVVDAFSTFNKVLILAGAALALILSLDWNRQAGHRPVRIPGADAVQRCRHDDHDVGRQPDDAVHGAGAAVAGALRAGRVRA